MDCGGARSWTYSAALQRIYLSTASHMYFSSSVRTTCPSLSQSVLVVVGRRVIAFYAMATPSLPPWLTDEHFEFIWTISAALTQNQFTVIVCNWEDKVTQHNMLLKVCGRNPIRGCLGWRFESKDNLCIWDRVSIWALKVSSLSTLSTYIRPQIHLSNPQFTPDALQEK